MFVPGGDPTLPPEAFATCIVNNYDSFPIFNLDVLIAYDTSIINSAGGPPEWKKAIIMIPHVAASSAVTLHIANDSGDATKALMIDPMTACSFELRAGWPKEPCAFPQEETFMRSSPTMTQMPPISIFPWRAMMAQQKSRLHL
jgi:hypothetical protein